MKVLKFIGFFSLLSIVMTSCNQNQKVIVTSPVIDTIQSGEGISRAIDYLTEKPSNWSQTMFDSIANKISSLAAAGDLDRNILEDKSLKERLFDSSASLLKWKVDSVFRLATYSGYAQMRKDLKFLQNRNKLFYEAGLRIEQTNQFLNTVEDIFDNYDKVLSLSKSQFYQRVTYLKNYSLDYSSTKRNIEENRYYKTYFCHNAEIMRNIKEFPERVKSARFRYLTVLEDTIEAVVVRNGYTYKQLLDDQSKFYNYANGVNQKAIDELNLFVNNYVDPNEKSANEDKNTIQ